MVGPQGMVVKFIDINISISILGCHRLPPIASMVSGKSAHSIMKCVVYCPGINVLNTEDRIHKTTLFMQCRTTNWHSKQELEQS